MSQFSIIGTPLYQWETGRQLKVVPLRGMSVDSVQFAHYGDSTALVVEPKKENGAYVADIPNVLLCSDQNIVVYSVNVSEDKTETLRECVFPVRKRAKPADYVYAETEVRSYETLENRIAELEKGSASPIILTWYDAPTEEQTAENIEVINTAIETGRQYDLHLAVNSEVLACQSCFTRQMGSRTTTNLTFADSSPATGMMIYQLSHSRGDGTIGARLSCSKLPILADVFDSASNQGATMAAIAEYVRLNSGNVTPEQIQTAVEKYLAENPIEAVTMAEVQTEIAKYLTIDSEVLV